MATLLVAAAFADLLAIALAYVGIEGGSHGDPWSHGLFMFAVWSALWGFLAARLWRSVSGGIIVGCIYFSHWILDLITHPIPFDTFSWRTWSWDFGRPVRSDLVLFFNGSPHVGLGLYNAISAVQATALEVGMLIAAAVLYARWRIRQARASAMK